MTKEKQGSRKSHEHQPGAELTVEAPEQRSLGSLIRAARHGGEMTLKQLAKEAELSISFLSQVERNQLTPSVSALKRIADVLRIPAGSLMFGVDGRIGATVVGMVRRDSRKSIVFPRSKISYELLTPDLRRRMSIFWLNAPPHSHSGPSFSHEGEDAVVVIKGKLRVETGGVWHELGEGDSLYFNSELPHSWSNESNQVSEVIWISTPPSF